MNSVLLLILHVIGWNGDAMSITAIVVWTYFIHNTSLFPMQVQQCSNAREGEHSPLLDDTEQAHCEENVWCPITTDIVWYIFKLQEL